MFGQVYPFLPANLREKTKWEDPEVFRMSKKWTGRMGRERPC